MTMVNDDDNDDDFDDNINNNHNSSETLTYCFNSNKNSIVGDNEKATKIRSFSSVTTSSATDDAAVAEPISSLTNQKSTISLRESSNDTIVKTIMTADFLPSSHLQTSLLDEKQKKQQQKCFK